MGDLKMKSEKRNCCQMLAGTLLGYLGYSSPMTWQGALRARQQFHFFLFLVFQSVTTDSHHEWPWEDISVLLLVNYTATNCDINSPL